MKGLPLRPAQILDSLLARCPHLVVCREEIVNAYKALVVCYKCNKGKVLLCGNGGSAADCEHMAAELLKSFRVNRPLAKSLLSRIPDEVAEQLEGSLAAIPLTSLIAFHSAFANDRNGEYAFAQLVQGIGVEGDVLFAISTSGNSRNILHTLEVARAKKIFTIGLSGVSGGAMKTSCDLCICVPAEQTDEIQEFHLPVYHALCAMIESNIFCHLEW
jgi:D-sedoheptulose 7-phosphate isomerase